MGQLQLALLGTPEVRHAGKLLTLPTRKTLALLIYLVVERGVLERTGLVRTASIGQLGSLQPSPLELEAAYAV